MRLQAALVLSAAVAAAAGAIGGGACSDDADCQHNGICSAGVCKCDPPWGSATCGTLRTDPAPRGSVAVRNPASSSWGGRPVRWKDGKWHLYVVDFMGCGMNEWRNSSRVMHFTADGPGGPFAEAGVALPVYAHNPDTVALPSGELVIFHIGESTASRDGKAIADCSANGNGTTPEAARVAYRPAPAPPKGFTGGAKVHVADTPDGPWRPVEIKAVLADGTVGALSDCDNPAPAVLPNGTVLLWCAPCGGCYGVCNCSAAGPDCICKDVRADAGFRLFSAQRWGDPFVLMPGMEVRIPRELYQEGFKLDDATLWADPRGRLHVLHHNGQGPPPCGLEDDVGLRFRDGNPLPVACGAHLHSADGRLWRMGPVSAYNSSVPLDHGSLNLYRQRPKVVQDPATGALTHLLHGVMECALTKLECLPQPNGTLGIRGHDNIDYSWTSIVPLAVGQ